MPTTTSALRALVVILTLAPGASAQIIAELSPAHIAEAIALGGKPKEAKRFLEDYRLRTRAFGSNGPTIGVFTTPFSRVVALALEAHERYAPLKPDAIDASALTPEVRVHAWPTVVSERTQDIASVRAIVLTPAKSKDRTQAIQPVRSDNEVTAFSNLFGAVREGTAMTAVFPIEVFSEGREVHVVFERRINTVGINYCDDCKVEIKLQGLK